MTFKTLCEHIIQDDYRNNEMCGCYVYKDSIYCETHEPLYNESNSCFENVIKYFQKLIRNWNNSEIDNLNKLV